MSHMDFEQAREKSIDVVMQAEDKTRKEMEQFIARLPYREVKTYAEAMSSTLLPEIGQPNDERANDYIVGFCNALHAIADYCTQKIEEPE